MQRAEFATRHVSQNTQRRAIPVLISILMTVMAFLWMPSALADEPIRIGLTKAVFVDDGLAYGRWRKYLEVRLGHRVDFVQRKTYNDIQQLLKLGEVDFAWICGFPFVQGKRGRYLKYVVTPVMRGKPVYEILLIVPSTSKAASVEDLKGGLFAFSDPDSVSFRALVSGYVGGSTRIQDLASFFKINFFTYDHVSTIQAVADGLVDGGSVDSHVWQSLLQKRPELADKVKAVARSESYGLPPFVASYRTPTALVDRVGRVLVDMQDTPEGREILKGLQVSRFAKFGDDLYDSIRNGPALGMTEQTIVKLSPEDKR